MAGKWAGYIFSHLNVSTYPFTDPTKNVGFGKMWKSIRATYNEKDAMDHQLEYAYGWTTAIIMEAAAKRTVEQVGWDNFSRQAIVEKGLPGLTIDTKGLTGRISYADYPDDRTALGMQKFGVFDVEAGTLRPLSDWGEEPRSGYPPPNTTAIDRF